MSRRKPAPPGMAVVAHLVTAWQGWRKAAVVASLMWVWRHWRGVGSVVLAALVFLQTGEPVLAGVTLVLLYALARWPRLKRGGWWDQQTLSRALVDAKIQAREGEQLPTLSHRGKPVHTDHGTTVRVALPQPRSLSEIAARREHLAFALRVPEQRLDLSRGEDDPANVVRIHVANGKPAGTPAAVVTAASSHRMSGL